MVRPARIDINLNELKYYPFMSSLTKCTGICNVLSPKICVPKETKEINVKAFNMMINKDESKAMTEDISCDSKFNSTTCNPKLKWNSKTCQCECKSYCMCEKDYSLNPSKCI